MDWSGLHLQAIQPRSKPFLFHYATHNKLTLLNCSILETSRQIQDLQPGLIVDMSVDPTKDIRVEAYRAQTRHEIGQQDPLIVIGTPPCTVFSSMQNRPMQIMQRIQRISWSLNAFDKPKMKFL